MHHGCSYNEFLSIICRPSFKISCFGGGDDSLNSPLGRNSHSVALASESGCGDKQVFDVVFVVSSGSLFPGMCNEQEKLVETVSVSLVYE